jgi:hypothetical protein
MKPELVISQFLREEFTDERLAILRYDAANGLVPFEDSTSCLVGHARENYFDAWRTPGWRTAEQAYLALGCARWWQYFAGYDHDDSRKMSRLVKLCDAETARRAAARAEAVEKALEVATPPAPSSPSGRQSARSLASKAAAMLSSEPTR